MTEDEIRALQARNAELETANADLTAERDSFREENARLQAEAAERKKELEETKKLNFTLARTVNRETDNTDKLFNELLR